MQVYSFLLILILMVIIVGLSLFSIQMNYHESEKMNEEAAVGLANNLNQNNRILTSTIEQLALSPAAYENLRSYMRMTPADYYFYSLDIWHKTGNNTHFPDLFSGLFNNYPEIKSIDLILDDVPNYLHGDRKAVNGEKRLGKPDVTDEFYLFRLFQNPTTSQFSGQMYITFNSESLLPLSDKNQEEKLGTHFIFDHQGDILYEYGESIEDKMKAKMSDLIVSNRMISEKDFSNRYIINVIDTKEHYIVTLLDKKIIAHQNFKQVLPIVLIGGSVIIVLLIILNRLFRKYLDQVAMLVDMTSQVSEGKLDFKIDTSHMKLELKDLADAINQMVAGLNKYIEDIYILEIGQRDAQMRALQSQINPHFLYNTMEYIRMYALSKRQEELADVVYAFSSLLRNNTTQEKITTLKEELDFCEKYIYLYQVRYPDSIAYHFDIDERMAPFEIPKFLIQPLIENYFVHGIDYLRHDNAISVKGRYHHGMIEILIEDNGRGITPEKLNEIQEELRDTTQIDSESIGIKNVYQRLKGHFMEKSEIKIESEVGKGTLIIIRIKENLEVVDV